MTFPHCDSRSTDPNDRRWKALGFGHKTSSDSTWRWWSEAADKGPWRIAAPFGMAEYRLVGKKLYLDDNLVLEGKSQWDATWRAIAHFYAEVVPNTLPPPLAPPQ
ncbi:hypothetical protein [Paraburkholderia sp. BR10882]|uniref:hypothetical protein n=1 Tax=unclassified Paraburkholderia TaxID=2615204 RepID=UPI0034CDD7F7